MLRKNRKALRGNVLGYGVLAMLALGDKCFC